MSKAQIVTANALIEGDVIYLRADNSWTRHLSEAEVITDEAHAQTRLTAGAAQKSIAVGAYLTDVAVSAAGLRTTHFREEFRKTGPSNYFHGKQAELSNV